jgi:alpha-L-rhamnosidase
MNLYKSVAKAFDNKFFDANGKIKQGPETQTSYLLPLAFGLVPEAKKKNVQDHLIRKLSEANNHLRTGFLGTPLLSQVLDDMGRTDLIYKLLFNETYPSWFYSINQGATTIWERWNSYSKDEGFNAQKMNSLNHYAYGAIGEWIYERIGGIAPLEAGYKKIRIAPVTNTNLTSAEASLNTTYGQISSSWTLKGGVFSLTVTIPANTTAKVIIPGDVNKTLNVNGTVVEKAKDVKSITKQNGTFELEVAPGTYKFQSTF